MHIHIISNYEKTYTKEKDCKEYKIGHFLRGDIADYFLRYSIFFKCF